ncbi:hypothetical protein [Bifidobacterium felsineum]|uniref:hypothetical protein n=1 Tax=Bifidobacterium felsineum TaxID=2045440 RepID=UPI001BDC08CE|nr:hypothetical protein [Bifidobacterium felsineum]MBT1164656.1 hypothetical protein [Bifidobacterium felsineum]
MKMNADGIDHYPYRIRWSEEDNEYVGTCAELPGLSWLDSTPALTLNGIQQVAREVVEDMRKHGETMPGVFVQERSCQ